MGAWGAGPFDNDDAADWVWEFDGVDEAAGTRLLFDALGLAREPAYIDAPDGSVAVAAAALVSWINRPDAIPRSIDAKEAVNWIKKARPSPGEALREAALGALEDVRSSRSELAELWAESGDEAWQASLAQIEQNLSADRQRSFWQRLRRG